MRKNLKDNSDIPSRSIKQSLKQEKIDHYADEKKIREFLTHAIVALTTLAFVTYLITGNTAALSKILPIAALVYCYYFSKKHN